MLFVQSIEPAFMEEERFIRRILEIQSRRVLSRLLVMGFPVSARCLDFRSHRVLSPPNVKLRDARPRRQESRRKKVGKGISVVKAVNIIHETRRDNEG